MRIVSMATRAELVSATRGRYSAALRGQKKQILDEFVAVTGFHRKHAMRLLRGRGDLKPGGPRPQRRVYDEAVRTALIVVWEASDRICGKRLKPLMGPMVEAMERHGHLRLEAEVRTHLLAMSAATIDRALIEAKAGAGQKRRRGSVNGVRQSIPVRTFSDWGDPAPGFCEADLVWHSGPTAKGSFIQTLVVTDIATGWTECAPLLVREQTQVLLVLAEIRKVLPFALLGFDTDNDSVFMNETVRDYCAAEKITFTRCRPYRKNDQAWVEQKNGSIVRRIVGYRRFEGHVATTALAELYATVRLFVNFFQPSFKLAEKERQGSRVLKRYHKPATPYQRLIADTRTPDDVRQRLEKVYASLDPVRLLRDMRFGQQRLVDLADKPGEAVSGDGAPSLDQFLTGLRTAWQGGEIRPTSRAKPKAKRGRRRPDPFVAVTPQLEAWFKVEPWRTASELLEKLQAEHADQYPDLLLRTLQRRLKTWRSQSAHEMIFGAAAAHDPRARAAELVDQDRGADGNIQVRQRSRGSGTSVSEAIRALILFVALYARDAGAAL